MPETGRRDRHARVHQGHRRPADRAHRRRAIRLERLRDEADRVRELLGRRDHRLERALRERPVADVTPLRARMKPVSPTEYGGKL